LSGLVHALPIIGIVLGGCLFTGSIAWMFAEGRRANENIEQTLNRYVLPRHLTEKQIAAIADYLKGFEPQTVKILIPKGNSEAGSYASDFYTALQQGGWAVTSMGPCIDVSDRLNLSQEKLSAYTNDWCEQMPEGISLQFTQTTESAQINDPKHPKPDRLFSQALLKARVPITSSGGGSGVAITQNSFVIRIGARRMDDGDLIAKKQQQERARRVLEDGEDDVSR